jgi:NAD(P)-dependent dehydrogenase (short-subunit alcohol dehydrogenase family)
MDLKDKVAIVTGSGRGIGRALALEFGRQGTSVVCCARTRADIEETAALVRREGGRALAVPTDVADTRQVSRMVERTMTEFGRVDVLLNNAARIPVINALWEVDPDKWWEEIAVNLRGPMLCCRAVLPHMIEQNEGIIINMAGGTGIPGRTSYCCSKVALGRLTVLLAKELATIDSRVLVFAMGPGLVKTRRTLVEAESPQGQHWNPWTKKAFEAGEDRPPEDCAKATIKLIARAGPELSGETFSASDVLAE